MEAPFADRRPDANAAPVRDRFARPGRGERDEATGGRKWNRVALPPDAHELEEGLVIVQARKSKDRKIWRCISWYRAPSSYCQT
jgi:hypothetical protein